MKYLLPLIFLFPSHLFALSLEWDYEDDSRVTEFRLYQDQAQHYVISDPTARSVDGTTAGISGGHTYTLRACALDACSEPSNSLYLPVSPASIRITIEW